MNLKEKAKKLKGFILRKKKVVVNSEDVAVDDDDNKTSRFILLSFQIRQLEEELQSIRKKIEHQQKQILNKEVEVSLLREKIKRVKGDEHNRKALKKGEIELKSLAVKLSKRKKELCSKEVEIELKREEKRKQEETKLHEEGVDEGDCSVDINVTSSNTTVRINLSLDDTIRILKRKVHNQTGFPIKSQLLQLNGTTLEDNDRPFSHYFEAENLEGEDNTETSGLSEAVVGGFLTTINLTRKKVDDQLTIFIKSLHGNMMNVYADDQSETVENIRKQMKHCIDLQTLTHIEKQTIVCGRMFCNGVELDDNTRTLSEYNIKNKSIIFIVTKRGKDSTSGIGKMKNSSPIKIPEPELRGITLGQLKSIVIKIQSDCQGEGWKDKDGKLFLPEDVSLYDLNKNFIKKVTQKCRCSYVELVATRPQKPKWFVSHWWGESVFNFVLAIDKHAEDHNLDDDTAYWVCAYALNQHDVIGEVGNNPKDSPFYRAMMLSEGTVSVLDQSCICLTRIWCSFEIYLSIIEFLTNQSSKKGADIFKRYQYNVYTLGCSRTETGTRNIPVGITDGCVASDKLKVNADDGTLDLFDPYRESDWIKNQAVRQKMFPLDRCRQVLRVKLETADSTEHIDKIRILNYISGNYGDLDDENVPDCHEKYSVVNRLLRGKFASSAYLHALEAGEDMEEYTTVLSKAPLEHLEMTFSECGRFIDESVKFFVSLPTTLKEIDLDFTGLKFHSTRHTMRGLGRLHNLTSLELKYGHCNLEDTSAPLSGVVSMFAEEFRSIRQLQELSLDFRGNHNISSLRGIEELIVSNNGLSFLELNFEYCYNISSLVELVNGLAKAGHLYDLNLNFKRCSKVRDKAVVELVKVLVNHRWIATKLSLDFRSSGCSSFFTDALFKMKDVRELKETLFTAEGLYFLSHELFDL